jgi:ketopantoate hydroxymethyltransferase
VIAEAVRSAGGLFKEAGVDAIKLEGEKEKLDRAVLASKRQSK